MSTPAPAAAVPLLRVVVSLLAFFVLAMHATGARVVLPGLKERTRTVMPQRVRRPVLRRRSGVARALDNGRKAERVRLAVTAWVNALPRLVRGRPLKAPGADVFSAKRASLIWKALGGHGRLGPGSTS